jgi:ATP-binding cassette, subfamily B, multidrug efflux pump
MAGHESAIFAEERLDTSWNAGLILRVAALLKPHRRLVIAASFLILVSIGLELSFPFITRTAIDSYLVPYSLRLDTIRMSSELKTELSKSVPEGNVISSGSVWYLSERDWRKLDPGLTARLRASGAVDARRWYSAPPDGSTERLASGYPHLFTRVENQILIADDDLQRLSKQDLEQLRRSDAHGLMGMALLFSLASGLMLVVSYFQAVSLEQAGQQMMMDLRLFLYNHILSRSLIFFGRNPVGKLVTRINNDVQNIAELFQNMLVGLFRDLFLFAGIAVVMFALNASLAAVCLLVAPLMAVITYIFARVAREIFRRLKAYTGSINTLLQETLAGMTAVKLLGAESAILSKLDELNTSYFRAGLAQVKMFAVFNPLMELLGSLAIALIVWYGGGAVVQDRLSLGTLVAFITYMQMLLIPIRDLSEKYNQLQGALASVERIYSVLDDDTALPVAPAPRKGSAPDVNAEIDFQSVHFGYRDHLKVFEGLNLTIPWGQTVTVVGPSGGGKSTLVNLLLRLYDPWEGKILLRGRDLRSIPAGELARSIALVSQEIILLASSIEENITLGRRDITPDMLANALEISGVTTWMGLLSEGIRTRIGEGGRVLSQGQRQMLSLARALAGNPRILILDEAFSQIDPESERLITSRLPSIMAGRTCILVAHRLSTARQSQRILVMRNGRIVEDGDHRTLIASKGIYADLVAVDQLDHRAGE